MPVPTFERTVSQGTDMDPISILVKQLDQVTDTPLANIADIEVTFVGTGANEYRMRFENNETTQDPQITIAEGSVEIAPKAAQTVLMPPGGYSADVNATISDVRRVIAKVNVTVVANTNTVDTQAA